MEQNYDKQKSYYSTHTEGRTKIKIKPFTRNTPIHTFMHSYAYIHTRKHTPDTDTNTDTQYNIYLI